MGRRILKPPYAVPTMDDIRALSPNGYVVASTFSGCGGSSLGYRMAGFKVAWASEFVEAARDTYKANAPQTHVDPRDIREVTAEDILEVLGGRTPDIFDGSPPCSAFSMAGSRDKGWGSVKKYSDTAQRVDDLFFEYVRILQGLQPKTFVAENVPGLVVGNAKGYFREIMAALRDAGYRVKAAVLDSQWLGVPQARRRLIFVGVREDFGVDPVFPKPRPYRYTMRDALPHLSGVLRFDSGFQSGSELSFDEPVPTIMAGGVGGSGRSQLLFRDDTAIEIDGTGTRIAGTELDDVMRGDKRQFTIRELRKLSSFPDDFILPGPYAKQWERMGRAVPPVMMRAVAETLRDEVLPRCVE